jgi:hypothetical protein
VAWLWLNETGSIIIREKRKCLSKISDRASRNVLERKHSRVESRECFIEVYINNRSLFVIVYYIKCALSLCRASIYCHYTVIMQSAIMLNVVAPYFFPVSKKVQKSLKL